MIVFVCSGCRKQLSVKEDLAGKRIKCRGCGQVTVVPGRPTQTASHMEDMGTLPPADTPRFVDFLSPPQSPDELGRLGNYRILTVLGHGGMGVVYKAEDTRLKRAVAIKAMLPGLAVSDSAAQRFLREAQAMAAVKHDHIVTIYQVDEDRGIPFLAMELLAGEPLDERLKREEKLPLPEVLRIGREVASALGAAHATGLIHRDIKPANIWLESDPGRVSAGCFRVKILDFGLARATSREAGLTQQGAIMGTPAYMAPEQAQGNAVDIRADLFSLGVVLYRLGTGELPFKGEDTVSTLMAVLMSQPEPPDRVNPDLPRPFSDLVLKLLEKDPDRRYSSARTVITALENLDTNPARKKATGQKTLTRSTRAESRAAGRRVDRDSRHTLRADAENEFLRHRRAEPAPHRRWLVVAATLVLLGVQKRKKPGTTSSRKQDRKKPGTTGSGKSPACRPVNRWRR